MLRVGLIFIFILLLDTARLSKLAIFGREHRKKRKTALSNETSPKSEQKCSVAIDTDFDFTEILWSLYQTQNHTLKNRKFHVRILYRKKTLT